MSKTVGVTISDDNDVARVIKLTFANVGEADTSEFMVAFGVGSDTSVYDTVTYTAAADSLADSSSIADSLKAGIEANDSLARYLTVEDSATFLKITGKRPGWWYETKVLYNTDTTHVTGLTRGRSSGLDTFLVSPTWGESWWAAQSVLVKVIIGACADSGTIGIGLDDSAKVRYYFEFAGDLIQADSDVCSALPCTTWFYKSASPAGADTTLKNSFRISVYANDTASDTSGLGSTFPVQIDYLIK